jgi:hypothetical protein
MAPVVTGFVNQAIPAVPMAFIAFARAIPGIAGATTAMGIARLGKPVSMSKPIPADYAIA